MVTYFMQGNEGGGEIWVVGVERYVIAGRLRCYVKRRESVL